MQRKTVQMTVPVIVQGDGDVPTTQYLQPDGSVGEFATALRLRFHLTATPVERIRIRGREYALAGGRDPLLQLEREHESVQGRLHAAIELDLWPGGVPDGDEESVAKRKDARWRTWDSDDMTLWRELTWTLDVVSFLARWEVLAIEPPPGWESLADRALTSAELQTITMAYKKQHEAALVGNGQPSEPSRQARGGAPLTRT